ncbi:MAG: UDP-N-acetylmuramoyl-tripeptide--D-alanyl-D-alanine ligase [Puniceicoccales bacterium]|jgi:UDP-N-acetylmuramoyl-tripeptide--D-alanyl-D-alanine ligase|nr:UDP-N-acetylmuramoyl-tripeptide--D-alanyl-D-alanine ligase [Puniceicoccales bacterium]
METTIFRQLPDAFFHGDFPVEISGFWNDTRTLRPGGCFLALTARRDGHEFLADAQRNGAHCAIVSRINKNLTLPQFRVADVLEAAKTIVKIYRKNYIIISVSGSYGKTSTKDMLRLLFGENAYATEENLNNELGVILSLSRIKYEQFGIIEGGIDHPGEMDRLIDLVRPNISVTTGIASVHLSNFENFNQLICEKVKILQDALARNGHGIVPEHCLTHAAFRQFADRCTIVGRSNRLAQYPHFTQFRLAKNNTIILRGKYFQNTAFLLPEMSLGQAENFAKAATVAKLAGIDDTVIQKKILQWKPGKMRGETIFFRGHAVYLDAYNANPVAMDDALRHFDKKYSGEKTYILGGMRELGPFSENSHEILAKYFFRKKNATIFAIGKEMNTFFERLRRANPAVKIFYFEDTETAKKPLLKAIRGTIFAKGSHAYHLEKIFSDGPA